MATVTAGSLLRGGAQHPDKLRAPSLPCKGYTIREICTPHGSRRSTGRVCLPRRIVTQRRHTRTDPVLGSSEPHWARLRTTQWSRATARRDPVPDPDCRRLLRSSQHAPRHHSCRSEDDRSLAPAALIVVVAAGVSGLDAANINRFRLSLRWRLVRAFLPQKPALPGRGVNTRCSGSRSFPVSCTPQIRTLSESSARPPAIRTSLDYCGSG